MNGYGFPANPRQARLWRYFNEVQDLFWAIRHWPNYIRDMAMKEHKSNRERYRLYIFFSANGLDPQSTMEWIWMKDYNHHTSTPIHENYDRSAIDQITSLEKKAGEGTLLNNVAYFDMILGRVVKQTFLY